MNLSSPTWSFLGYNFVRAVSASSTFARSGVLSCRKCGIATPKGACNTKNHAFGAAVGGNGVTGGRMVRLVTYQGLLVFEESKKEEFVICYLRSDLSFEPIVNNRYATIAFSDDCSILNSVFPPILFWLLAPDISNPRAAGSWLRILTACRARGDFKGRSPLVSSFQWGGGA